MQENRFFTWVWRFNGLIIALVTSLILCILVWEVTRDLRRTLFPTQTTQVINAVPAPSDHDAQNTETGSADILRTTRFGQPWEVGAAHFYAVPQYVQETYSNRGISKESGGNLVNYLVVDTRDQSTRWLFQDATRLIADTRPLYHTPSGGTRQFKGHLLRVIEQDTNGNGQLSPADMSVLYFTDANWAAPVRLTGDLKSILFVRMLDATRFDVLQTGGAATTLSRYSLPEGRHVFEIDLDAQN